MYELNEGQLLVGDDIKLPATKMSRALYKFKEQEIGDVKVATEFEILPVEIELSGIHHQAFLDVYNPTKFNCKISQLGSNLITTFSNCNPLSVIFDMVANTTTIRVLPEHALMVQI